MGHMSESCVSRGSRERVMWVRRFIARMPNGKKKAEEYAAARMFPEAAEASTLPCALPAFFPFEYRYQTVPHGKMLPKRVRGG